MPSNNNQDDLFRYNCGFLAARIGEWVYTVALNWVVLTSWDSPWLLAVVNACRLAPCLLLSVPAGLLAERRDPGRLSRRNHLGNALVMGLIGAALAGKAPLALVLGLVLLQACLTAWEAPLRNVHLHTLFQGERRKTAVAHNATFMNLGRLIGPLVAGFLLGQGATWLPFLVAAALTVSFSVITAGVRSRYATPPSPPSQSRSEGPSWGQLWREQSELRALFGLALAVMFFGFPYTAMLSLLTESVLGLGAQELGLLTSVAAAGALLASFRLGQRPEATGWSLTWRYALGFALSLAALVGVTGLYSAAVVLFAVGYLGQAYRSCSRMHWHDVVPSEWAGRLLGLSLMDRAMIPLGALALGALAEWTSPRGSYAVMALGCLLSVLVSGAGRRR